MDCPVVVLCTCASRSRTMYLYALSSLPSANPPPSKGTSRASGDQLRKTLFAWGGAWCCLAWQQEEATGKAGGSGRVQQGLFETPRLAGQSTSRLCDQCGFTQASLGTSLESRVFELPIMTRGEPVVGPSLKGSLQPWDSQINLFGELSVKQSS